MCICPFVELVASKTRNMWLNIEVLTRNNNAPLDFCVANYLRTCNLFEGVYTTGIFCKDEFAFSFLAFPLVLLDV